MTPDENSGGSFPDDRGSPMRQWLIRLSLDQPFVPFMILLEGGFRAKVSSPEFLSFEPGVLVLSVYESSDIFQVFPVDRIVALKVLG